MRFSTVLVSTAAAGAALLMSTGPAMAGEVGGNGHFTPNHTFGHSQSICSFSGLQDGDGAGFPGPGGAPPQNWGHSKEAFGATPADRKASGFQPGDSCNGHTGFVAQADGEAP
jgi:hypothetical protein